jgi:SAM-dependent methyltransferase
LRLLTIIIHRFQNHVSAASDLASVLQGSAKTPNITLVLGIIPGIPVNMDNSFVMNVTDAVARQYSEWAYPKPIDDMVAAIKGGVREPDTPSLVLPLLWPERRPIKGLKVLVAGCGTNQGAYYALMMPQAEITGIDLSVTSLNHEKFLIGKHDIKNLVLCNMSLLDVDKLKKSYDFVVCSGVLHHLADPDAGLRALRDVLLPDGIISIMVYGRYLRQGIYMLQEAFKLLGLGQNKEDIELIKSTLKDLPEIHCATPYIKAATDIKYDSGIVDTFLHPQDRAYSVGELLAFARNNKLEFWGWVDPLMYSDKVAFPAHHLLKNKVARLDVEERWKVVELLTQRFGFHQVFLCHPSRRAKRIDFIQPGWEDFIPVLRPCLRLEKGDPAVNKRFKLKRRHTAFRLSNRGAALIERVNGKRSIVEIMALARENMPEMTPEGTREFFALMHELGHLMYWRTCEARAIAQS